MTQECRNIELISRWFDQVWNQGIESAIDEMYAVDGVAWGLGEDYVKGPEAFKQFHRLFLETLSNIEYTIDDMIAAGDRVAMRGKFEMTHKATGKQITIRGGGIAHIRDGKIIEAWNAWDFLGALVQIGSLSENAFAEALRGGGSVA